MVIKKKTCQTFLGTKRNLVGLSSIKSSSHGEELEEQEKMKMKKKRKNGCKKKPMELLFALKETPQVCMLEILQKKLVELLSTPRKARCQEQVDGKRMRICRKKSIELLLALRKAWWVFFGKVDFTWRKLKATRKDEVEEKEEEWLHEKTRGVSFDAKKSSMGVWAKTFAKNIRPSFFRH